MQIIKGALAFLAAGLLSLSAHAHEFWIEPSDFYPDTGSLVTADLVIGTDFLGYSTPYTPDNIAAFGVIDAVDDTPIKGRYGDVPAGQFKAGVDGLAIIYHQTGPLFVDYQKPEKFMAFASQKGFADIAGLYKQTPAENFTLLEQYRRFAKSLIRVGQPSDSAKGGSGGHDRVLGLELELVALTTPYDQPPPKNMVAAVYESSVPRPRAQVTVFVRHNPRKIDQFTLTTNEDGVVTIPLLPGRQYLLDSVVLRRPLHAESVAGADWESLWASLTFAVPDH